MNSLKQSYFSEELRKRCKIRNCLCVIHYIVTIMLHDPCIVLNKFCLHYMLTMNSIRLTADRYNNIIYLLTINCNLYCQYTPCNAW